jgi:VanZ family protein
MALGAYWLAIFVGTHIPRLPMAVDLTFGFDKVCHFFGFAGLAFLAGIAWSLWRPADRPLRWSNLAIVLLALTVYGSLDELTQPLVHRTCELADWLADVAGAAFGLGCFSLSTSFVRRTAAVELP